MSFFLRPWVFVVGLVGFVLSCFRICLGLGRLNFCSVNALRVGRCGGVLLKVRLLCDIIFPNVLWLE